MVSSHFQLETACGILAAGNATGEVRSWALYALAILAVGLAALVWVAFIRKARKRRKRINRPHTWELDPNQRRDRGRHRRSRSHEHRSERPMNPTLADAGGLPPVRPDDAPEPPPHTD